MSAPPPFVLRGPAVCLAAVVAWWSPHGAAAQGVLEPTPADEETYSETITAIADLRDGTYVQVQLNVSNVGLGDGNGGCRVLIVSPGRAPWSGLETLDRDDWSYEAPALSFGPCSALSDGGTTRVVANVKGAEVDLSIAAAARRIEPPGARLSVGERRYAFAILVPWAAVSATVKAPRDERRNLTGHAYVDHFRGTTLPAQVAARWVRFRGLRDQGSILLLARFAPKKGDLFGWWWRDADGGARRLASLVVNQLSGGDPSRGYRIEGGAADATFVIETREQLYRYAPVEEYGFLGRMAGSVVGNPITRTFRAQLTVAGGAALPGLLEVQDVE